jgi:hypothetical protein
MRQLAFAAVLACAAAITIERLHSKRDKVTLSVEPDAAPQVVRLCEFSHALDSPIACRCEDSFVPLSPGVSDQPYTLGNAIVTANAPVELEFTCPSSRTGGAFEPGGAFSIYSGPVFPDDGHSPIRVR